MDTESILYKVRVKDLSFTRYGYRIYPIKGTGKGSVLYKIRIQNLSYTRYGYRICPLQDTDTESILYKVRVQDLSHTRYMGTGSVLYQDTGTKPTDLFYTVLVRVIGFVLY